MIFTLLHRIQVIVFVKVKDVWMERAQIYKNIGVCGTRGHWNFDSCGVSRFKSNGASRHERNSRLNKTANLTSSAAVNSQVLYELRNNSNVQFRSPGNLIEKIESEEVVADISCVESQSPIEIALLCGLS